MDSDVSKKFEECTGKMNETTVSSKVVQDIISKHKTRVSEFKENCKTVNDLNIFM